MSTFLDIALAAGTDKVTEHAYQDVYPLYLEKWRDEEFNLIEIGVAHGASMQLWHEYLRNALVYGVDNDPSTNPSFLCDVTSPEFVGLLDHLSPRVVIDDGGHFKKQQQAAFRALWPILESGGYYFIEDLHVRRANMYTMDLAFQAECLMSGKDELGIKSMHIHPEMCVLEKA